VSDRPLHEYIDLEAYGVVTQEVHDALKARVSELEAALRKAWDQLEELTGLRPSAGDGGGA